MQNLFRRYLIIFFLVLLTPSLAFSFDGQEAQSERADSISVLRNKYRSQTILEQLGSLPGYLAYAPLKTVFEMQKFFIEQAFVMRVKERNFIAKILDIFITDDGRRGVIPTYSSSSGGGLKFYQKGLFTPNSKLSLSATAGLRGRQQYRLKLKNIEFGQRVNSQFLIKYHFQPDESFYGIGPHSDKDDRTNFANELITAELNVGIQIFDGNRIGLVAGFDRNDISGGRNKDFPSTTEVPSFAALPGTETEVQVGRLELEIHHDSRNHPGRPNSGFEAVLRGGVFRQTDDDTYGFSRLSLAASRYFHLFYNRALKLRFAAELAEAFKDRGIPFYYLSELGRSETVRGFARGRFRDRDMILGSVEYIYPIWEKINAHLFFDSGTVSPNIFRNFETSNLRNGYGVGLSVWNDEGIMGNFAVAFSKERFRFYLDLNVSL